MIRAYSDLHGILPKIEPCETLLISGDICPVVGSHDPHVQNNYLRTHFSEWCSDMLLDGTCQEIILTPGNHDFIFELPRDVWQDNLPIDVTVLIDEEFTLKNGLTIWGSPWVPNLETWAFYASDEKLEEYASMIPEGIDIWMMHGPPDSLGRLDRINGTSLHVGNPAIKQYIASKKPKGYICGHIHEGFGYKVYQGTQIMNVSFLDDFYDPMFRHGCIDYMIGGELAFWLETKRYQNPYELFYSCRGEVGY